MTPGQGEQDPRKCCSSPSGECPSSLRSLFLASGPGEESDLSLLQKGFHSVDRGWKTLNAGR